MYNFTKKIIGIFILVLIVIGNNSFAQENTSQDEPCQKPTGAIKTSLGLCKCPEGKKEVNNECKLCSDPGVCCGIQLNTSIPFIGDCIEFGKKESTESQASKEMVVPQEEAFPTLMGYLIKILVTVILLGSFIAILAGGMMISAAGPDEQKAAKGKKLIINVVVALAILGASGVILRLINPNFFQ